jgi:hypothetical protein
VRALLLALAFSPALATALFVHQHAVNVPVWDDWERAPLVAAWEEGTLGFGDLYAPHIDHRMVFPRALMLVLNRLSGGDLVWENWSVYAIVLAAALAVHGLARRTLGEETRTLYGATFLCNLLIFSPLQWENLLWAVQTAFVLPMACLCAALLVLQSRLSRPVQFGLCLAAAVVATHSFSHGLLLWAAIPAVVLLKRDLAPPSARRRFLAAWLVAAAVVLVPYFTVGGYKTTSVHNYGVDQGEPTPALALLSESLSHPLSLAHFHLSMVGSQLARLTTREARDVAPVTGLLVHGLLLAAVAGVLARWRDSDVWNRSVPWVVLGGVALAACALASLGRALATSGLYALAPRYVSISLYVLLATVALAALLLRERGARWTPALLAGALICAQAGSWFVGLEGMRMWQQSRLQARTSLLFINHYEPRYVRRLDWDPEYPRAMANLLNRYGYLDPPLSADTKLAHFELSETELAAERGRIDLARATGEQLIVRGRAWLPGDDHRDSHGVLLTVRNPAGQRFVVGVGEGRSQPSFPMGRHDHLFNEIEFPFGEGVGRWKAKVSLSALPASPDVEVEVWAVDAGRMRLHRLAQRIAVRRSGDAVSVETREALPRAARER